MKNVKEYINEALRIKSGMKISAKGFTFVPETFYELVEFICKKKDESKNSDTLDLSLVDCSQISTLENLFGLDRIGFLNPRLSSNIKRIDVTGWNVSKIKNFNAVFSGCEYVEEIIGVENWDMSSAENINAMFCDCKKLKELDLSKWNMPNLGKHQQIGWSGKGFYEVFKGCMSLEKLKGYEKWNLSEYDYMSSVFKFCEKLKYIDISKWQLKQGKEQYINDLFLNCKELERVNVSNIVTKTFEKTVGVFKNCINLTEIIGLDTWDMENVFQTSELFKNCSSIVSLDALEQWELNKLTYANEMFAGCHSLETIGDISHWDIKKLVEMSRMFNGCKKLASDLSSWTIEKRHTKVNFPFTDTNKKIFKKPNIIA